MAYATETDHYGPFEVLYGRPESTYAYGAKSFLGFEEHDSMLGEGLGEYGDVGYQVGDVGDLGFDDGAFGQAIPVPAAVAPPPSSPSILDSLLSPVTSLTGLSSMTLLLIGGAVAAYVYRDRLFGKKSAAEG